MVTNELSLIILFYHILENIIPLSGWEYKDNTKIHNKTEIYKQYRDIRIPIHDKTIIYKQYIDTEE